MERWRADRDLAYKRAAFAGNPVRIDILRAEPDRIVEPNPVQWAARLVDDLDPIVRFELTAQHIVCRVRPGAEHRVGDSGAKVAELGPSLSLTFSALSLWRLKK